VAAAPGETEEEGVGKNVGESVGEKKGGEE